jgi:hypothetical protein
MVKGIKAIIALAFFAGLLAAGICLAEDDANTSDNSNVDIPKRAQEEIKKVDELSQAEKEQAEALKKQQYLDNFHDEPAGSLLTKEEIEKINQQKKEREQSIRDRAEQETAPAVSEAEQPQPAGFNPPPARKGQPVANSPGTVTGIVLYMGKGAALVLGNVVREGDTVRGNKVNKITSDYVEFEKQGNKWKQQVGQAPPPGVWDKPNTNQQTGAAKKQEAGKK